MKAISLALGLFFLVHASCMAEESSSVFTEQDIPNIIAYHNTFGGPKFASKYGSAMFSGSGVFAGSKFDNIPFVGDRYFVAVITALGSVGCFEVSAPDPSIIVGDSVQIVSTRPTIMYVSDLMLNGAQAGTIVLGANCVIKSNSGSIMPPSDNNSGNSGKSGSTWQAARKDGLAARDAYEAWLAGLVGDTRAGADYWAAHRSLSRPGTCQSTDADVNNVSFRSGCENAKRILAPSDVRRKSEPAFRLGWNSFAPRASTVNPSTSEAAAAPADSQWYFASTVLGKCSRVSDIFPGKAGNYPSTPEGIIAGTGGGSAYSLDRPSYGPDGPERHGPGPVVRLTDILGRYPTLALVQGRDNCQKALTLFMKERTSGSAEQRWAARNADRDGQWHVVYWAGEPTACTPLSEVVSSADSPEQAAEIIKENDPDAYLDLFPDRWYRVIRTQGHNLILVKNRMYCNMWSSMPH
jgi:hypothetical protein